MYKKKGFRSQLFIVLLLVVIFFFSIFSIALLSYPSNAAASNSGILDTKVQGQDRIQGFAKKTDVLTFEVTANINEPITRDQMTIGIGKPDTCIQKSFGDYLCSLSKSTDSENPGEQVITVNVQGSGGNTVDSKTISYLIDIQAPEINSFSAVSFNNQITAIFSAKDTACPTAPGACPNCNSCNKCVGIKEIKIEESLQGRKIHEKKTNHSIANCAVSDSVSFSSKAPQGYSGNTTVCVSVLDHFNQASLKKCADVLVDKTGPELKSMILKDSNNKEIFYKGIPLNSVLRLNFSSDSLSSVFADLSPFNPTLGKTQGNCARTGGNSKLGNYTCLWTFSLFNPNITKQIAINATDDRGNSLADKLSFSIGMDNQPPLIKSVEMLRADDNTPVEFVNGNTLVILKVNVTDDNLKMNSVKVNISDINKKDNFFTTNCVLQFNDSYSCSLSGITLVMNGTRSVRIPVSASDILGNNRQVYASINVVFDNTKPNITEIGTFRRERNNKSWAGAKNNTLYIKLQENKAGMSRKNAKLEIQGQKFKAGECFRNSDGWVCLWKGINFTTAGEITVNTHEVFDDARNKAADKSEKITVDLTPPEIRSVKMINDSLTADCPINGDTIHYEIKSFDQTPQIFMTLNNINVSTTRTFDGFCENTSPGNWKCDVFIDKIVPFTRNGTILFEAEDFAGNKKKFNQSITICKGDLITEPNFINATLRNPPTIPASVDRKVASLTNHLILVPVHYDAKLNVKVARTDDDDCISSLQYIYDGYPVNTINAFSMDPMISFKLRQGQYSNPVPIKCQLRLRIRAGTTVYVKPELENISFNVNFNDNSLGNLDAAINAKLLEVSRDIDSTQGRIDGKEKQLKFLKTLCETAKMIGTINSLLQAVKKLLHHVFFILVNTLRVTPQTLPLAHSVDSAWTGICNALSQFHSIVSTFIWPPGFIPGGLTGGDPFDAIGMFLVKYPCMIQYYCMGMDEIAGNIILEGANTFGFSQIPLGGNTGPPPPGGANVVNDIVTSVIQPGPEGLDPYKSVHLAGMCVPAQMYNLMKEKQIKCMYRDCLKNHLNTGVSTVACDVALSERECLYIEGAGAKGRGGLFHASLESFKDLKKLAFLAVGVAYKLYCQDYIKKAGTACFKETDFSVYGPNSNKATICGITGTVITLKELMETFQSVMGPQGQKYEQYFKMIKQKDFCTSAAS